MSGITRNLRPASTPPTQGSTTKLQSSAEELQCMTNLAASTDELYQLTQGHITEENEAKPFLNPEQIMKENAPPNYSGRSCSGAETETNLLLSPLCGSSSTEATKVVTNRNETETPSYSTHTTPQKIENKREHNNQNQNTGILARMAQAIGRHITIPDGQHQATPGQKY